MAQKDFRKLIKLENERSTHLEKKVNELTAWQFFKLLYNSYMLKTIALNLIMLVFFAPAIWLFLKNSLNISSVGIALPITNSVGLGLAPWLGVGSYVEGFISKSTTEMYLWLIPAFALVSISISGSFAVIRDAFWTGKVQLIKPFFKSVAENALIIAPFLCLLSAAIFGVYTLSTVIAGLALSGWITLPLNIIMWAAVAFFALYLFIFFAVTTVYKQSVWASLKSAWHLLGLNLVPNILKFVIAFVPAVMLFVLNGFFFTLLLSLCVMLGLYYVAFVWMHFMMRTFTLFNPVAKKRIN